jgi:hypothetical protein
MPRPLKKVEPETGGTVTIGLRVEPVLRAKLEAAAAEARRNLSQECVSRIEQSLHDEKMGPVEWLVSAIDVLEAGEGRGNFSPGRLEFVRVALNMVCGSSEASTMAAWFAFTAGLVRSLNATGAGRLQIRKSDLDRLKAAIRELERDCVIAKEE